MLFSWFLGVMKKWCQLHTYFFAFCINHIPICCTTKTINAHVCSATKTTVLTRKLKNAPKILLIVAGNALKAFIEPFIFWWGYSKSSRSSSSSKDTFSSKYICWDDHRGSCNSLLMEYDRNSFCEIFTFINCFFNGQFDPCNLRSKIFLWWYFESYGVQVLKSFIA